MCNVVLPLAILAVTSLAFAQTNSTLDKPKSATNELLKTFRQEFVEITPGKGEFPRQFEMGSADGPKSERPVHTVVFNKSFHIAKYEVPQNLWKAVMGTNPSEWKGERNSVEMLSFDDAINFCKKVTLMLRDAHLITQKQIVRLPNEAEWEYSTRAGTKGNYSFGEQSKIDQYAWHKGNAAGNDPPVGALKPNPWQLYDVHGYLWEWCSDLAHPNYEKAPTDGTARRDGDGKKRVLRGGSWKDPAVNLTSSFRRIVTPSTRDSSVGLRCVLANE